MVASDYSSRRSAIVKLAQRRENDSKLRYGITHTDIAKHLDITPTYARQYTSRLTKEGVLVKAPWTSPTGESIFTLPTTKELQKKTALLIAGNRVMMLTNREPIPTAEFIDTITNSPSDYYDSTDLEEADPETQPIFSHLVKRLMLLLDYELFIDEQGKADIEQIDPISKEKRARIRNKLETEMYGHRLMADMIETALNNPDTA